MNSEICLLTTKTYEKKKKKRYANAIHRIIPIQMLTKPFKFGVVSKNDVIFSIMLV